MLRSGAHTLARAAIAARVGVRGMATSDSGGRKSDFNKEEKHEMDRAAFVKMLRQLANNLNRKRSTARLPINLMGNERILADVPSGMKFEVELERGDKETELELTVKWDMRLKEVKEAFGLKPARKKAAARGHKLEEIDAEMFKGCIPNLKEENITTTNQLLLATKSEGEIRELAIKAGVDFLLIESLRDFVELVHLKGVGIRYADFLFAAKINTVEKLAKEKPMKLKEKMENVMVERRAALDGGTAVLGADSLPTKMEKLSATNIVKTIPIARDAVRERKQEALKEKKTKKKG